MFSEKTPGITKKPSLELEILEPRILMAANPFDAETGNITTQEVAQVQLREAIGDVVGVFDATASFSYQDAVTGSIVTISLKGEGQGQVVESENGFSINITGSTEKTVVKVSAKEGNQRAVIENINVDGDIKQIAGKTLDVIGNIDIVGSAQKIVLGNLNNQEQQSLNIGGDLSDKGVSLSFGDITNLSITSDTKIKALTALSWNDDNSNSNSEPADFITSSSLGKLSIKGKENANFSADLFLSGEGNPKQVLGSVKVNGAILRSQWDVNGDVKKIQANSISNSNWEIGSVSSIQTKADVGSSNIQLDGQLKSFKIGDFRFSALSALQIGSFSCDKVISSRVDSPVIGILQVNLDNGLMINGPLLVNQLNNLNKGERIVVTPDILLTTDVDNLPSEILYKVTELEDEEGFFEIAGEKVTSFTQQDINDGVVEFVHTNLIPQLQFSIFDGEGNLIDVFVNTRIDPTLDSIISTAQQGVPADPTKPSANPGQIIEIQGQNLTMSHTVVFATSSSTQVVGAFAVSEDGTRMLVRVPDNAVSGPVFTRFFAPSIIEQIDQAIDLQIVPLVNSDPLEDPQVEVDELEATVTLGTPADENIAAVNPGDKILITGLGFVDNIVEFETVDAAGNPSTIDVQGTPNIERSGLFVEVPTLARTGIIKVLGTDAEFALQIVPTISAFTGNVLSGEFLEITGAGFVENELQITVGGQNIDVFELVNSSSQQTLSFTIPDNINSDEVLITTNGGTIALSDFFDVDELQVSLKRGIAANPNIPAVNPGDTIEFTGTGFTNETIVEFTSEQGIVTATGIASKNGTSLSIEVPDLAITGTIKVVGANEEFAVQVVPIIDSIEGNIITGETIVLQGFGFVESELQITVGGQTIDSFTVTNSQTIEFTVPANINREEITLTTNGGSFTITTANVPEQGNTPFVINVPEQGAIDIRSRIDQGAIVEELTGLTKDSDFYILEAEAGEVFNIQGNFAQSFETMIIKVFNEQGENITTTFANFNIVTFSNGEQFIQIDKTFRFHAPESGRFFIEVAGRGVFSTRDYAFSVEKVSL